MDDPTSIVVDEIVHHVASSLAAMKAVMANACGVDSWDLLSEGVHSPVHQMLAGRSPLDESALRTALGAVAREIDLVEISMQNLLGCLGYIPNLTPQMRSFELSVVTSEVLSLLENRALKRGIRLVVQVEEEPKEFRGDPYLIRRALVNVIENAVRYSFSLTPSSDSAQRQVQCVIRRYSIDGHTLFQVQSFGVGILPDEIDHIFEYGRRGRLVRDRDRHGLGIGLSETKRIVEAHGGRVRLTSIQHHDNAYLTTISLIFPPAV